MILNHYAFQPTPSTVRARALACVAFLASVLATTASAGTCYVEVEQIVASDAMPSDLFSMGIDADGTRLAVGAADDDAGQNAGAVYLLRRTGGRNGSHSEVAKLFADDADDGWALGRHVDVSGSALVASANGAYIAPGVRAGAAYVFERNAGGHDNWGQAAKLVGSDADHGDGCSDVALDGDTAVYGSPRWSGPVVGQTGTAYIFERDEWGDWVETKQVIPSGAVGRQLFGSSMVLLGDTLVVGAHVDNERAFQSGAVYVFERHAGGIDNWGQVAKLKAADASNFSNMGSEVAFDGETLVAAAWIDNERGFQAGAAYVFEENEQGEWVQVAKLTSPDPGFQQRFGTGVVVMGNVIHVGEPFDPSLGHQTGASFLFERDGDGQWNFARRFIGSGTDAGDWFGWSGSDQGNRLFVGARTDDLSGEQDSGAVYVFERRPDRECD